MFEQYLAQKLLDSAIEAARRLLEESRSGLLTSRATIEVSLQHHLQSVENWSSRVASTEAKPKWTSDVFVDLDLFVLPRRKRISSEEKISSKPLKRMFDEEQSHFVVLGQVGIGKTTSMKYLCQALLHDADFYPERFSLPILVQLRDLNPTKDSPDPSLITDRIYNILGLSVELRESLREAASTPAVRLEVKSIKEKLAICVLDQLKALLILEGFDEITQTTRRDSVIDEIKTLATHLSGSTMVLTSRTGEFVYDIDNTVQYEIMPLGKEQITDFAEKRLNNREESAIFLSKVNNSPFADTTIRPLTLAYLCAIYERSHDIPDKPKSVYRRVVDLLLREWDDQNATKRISRYANFEVDRKFEFLCRLAYELTMRLKTVVFSIADLLSVYKDVHLDFNLASHEARQVVNELETHTGLFVQSGYEQFEFGHKSIQEYLTAEHIVRLPAMPGDAGLFRIPSELAITVTISSDPSRYLADLISRRFMMMTSGLSKDFVKGFVERLLLEKVDLNPNTDVGLLMVVLYSRYISSYVVKGKYLDQGEFDGVLNGLERLIKSAMNRESLGLIGAHYRIGATYEMEEGDRIHLMIMEAGLKEPVVNGLPLPDRLFIRSSF